MPDQWVFAHLNHTDDGRDLYVRIDRIVNVTAQSRLTPAQLERTLARERETLKECEEAESSNVIVEWDRQRCENSIARLEAERDGASPGSVVTTLDDDKHRVRQSADDVLQAMTRAMGALNGT